MCVFLFDFESGVVAWFCTAASVLEAFSFVVRDLSSVSRKVQTYTSSEESVVPARVEECLLSSLLLLILVPFTFSCNKILCVELLNGYNFSLVV